MCIGTGHCFWEKTKNGCRNEDDTFNFNAYDFYAVCRGKTQIYAEYQCEDKPAELTVGACKQRDEDDNKQERSSDETSDPEESEYHSYYYMEKTTDKKFCFECERSMYNVIPAVLIPSVRCGHGFAVYAIANIRLKTRQSLPSDR